MFAVAHYSGWPVRITSPVTCANYAQLIYYEPRELNYFVYLCVAGRIGASFYINNTARQ